jgi:hypothetical protein
MSELKTLDEVAEILDQGDRFTPKRTLNTVEDLVNLLIDLGTMDKVFAKHDDHLGLKESLSNDFLNASLNEMNESDFEKDIELVLEQANIIIPLSNR